MRHQQDRSVAGTNDEWMLFSRLTPDNYPLVVLARVNNPLVEQSLTDMNISIVQCEAEDDLVNERGMPQHTDRIYPLEDALAVEFAHLDVGILHVASITGAGLRQIIYTHPSPIDFGPTLQDLYVEGYSLSLVTPQDRDLLREVVSPTALDRQLDGDQRVISNLEQHGDDLATPRKTDFWFYGSASALAMVADELLPWGLSIDHWLEDPEGLVLTAHVPVDLDAFQELTPILIATAERHDVDYDGWETFVVDSQREGSEPLKQKAPSLLSKLFGAKKN